MILEMFAVFFVVIGIITLAIFSLDIRHKYIRERKRADKNLQMLIDLRRAVRAYGETPDPTGCVKLVMEKTQDLIISQQDGGRL